MAGKEISTQISIPVIDFTGLEILDPSGSPQWETVKSQVLKAMEEFGCFKAFYRGISLNLQQEILHEVIELFDLPLETQMEIFLTTPTLSYIGKTPTSPLYDSIGIDEPTSLEKLETVTKAFWPQGKSSFSTTVQSFSIEMSRLASTIMRMIVEGLGVEKYMEELMNAAISKLRVIKYDVPKAEEGPIVGLTPHMDICMTSILCQNQVDGLEIQTKAGDWISVDLSPDTFVVLAGQSFHAWTNGRLNPPYHRVTMSGNEARYSVGLFTFFKPGYMIKAPEELVDEEHPPLYRPFDFLEVNKRHKADAENYQEIGQNALVPLIYHYGV